MLTGGLSAARWWAVLAVVVLAGLAPVRSAQAVAIDAGDIIVVARDFNAVDSIIRVNPITGATTVISSGGLLHNPQGVAIDSAGQIVVTDPTNGLIRVDPSTGTQTLISSGGLLLAPFGVTVEPTGQILVADPASNAVVRVDPVTGAQTSLSADDLLRGPTDVAIDQSGRILVDDPSEEDGGRVVRIDPVTGAQALVSSDVYGARTGIEVDDAGSVIVTNQSGDLVRVDPDTGAPTVISSAGLVRQALGKSLDAAGRIIIAEWGDGIFRVDPTTGAQTVVSLGGGSFALFWAVTVALPDLAATAISDPPPAVLLGGRFPVTDTVQNQGSIGAGVFTIRYYLSADAVRSPGDVLLVGSRSLSGLAGGASSTGAVTVAVGSKTPLGTYHLLVCADADDVVAERWNSNNCRASAGQVEVQAPDLVPMKVDDPPPVALVGSTFVAGDKVLNQGNLVAGISSVRYYLSLDTTKSSGDRPLTGARAVPALTPGAASEDTITVTVPSLAAGSYYLIACADDTSRIAESEEDNNCRASARRVKVAGADLVVTAVSNPPVTASPGATFSVTETVRNQGGVAAAATTTGYYLSRDTRRDSGDLRLGGSRAVPGLAASSSSTGTVTVVVPPTAPSGTLYLLACADDTGAVPEISEADNCRASEARVNIPVLTP